MHISIHHASLLKPPALSQAPDSYSGGDNSHIKYDSAIGDKQSEISSSVSKVDKQNIKVMARFRPLNNME